MHIPLSFAGDATLAEALVATVLLFVFAPAMRHLMGRTDLATGGSPAWDHPHHARMVPTTRGFVHVVTAGDGPDLVLLPGTNFAAARR